MPRPRHPEELVVVSVTLTKRQFEALKMLVQEGVYDSISSAIRRILNLHLKPLIEREKKEGEDSTFTSRKEGSNSEGWL